MEEVQFNSLEELFSRLKPALQTKVCEMKRIGFPYVKIEDVWNYLKEVKWKKSTNLDLYEMVSDVLNTDNAAIDGYLKHKLNLKSRRVYFDWEEVEDEKAAEEE